MKTFVRLITLMLCIGGLYVTHENNVCKTIEDYDTIQFNPNCWYNPDATANVADLIKTRGYPFEEFESPTEDGYILRTFRIPNQNTTKGAVYLQHPLMTCASVWLDKGDSSLGFVLHTAGYDVWLGTFRSNSYTRHEQFDQNDEEFWDHSFHEMGIYDIPAHLKTVRKYSNQQKVYYVGHSMGTTAAFVYSSLLPEDAKEIVDTFVMLCPVAFLAYTKSPLYHIGYFSDLLLVLSKTIRHRTLIKHEGYIHNLMKWFCFNVSKALPLCMSIIVHLTGIGPDFTNINPEWYPHIFHQNFRGYSVKTGIHYAQHMLHGKFTFYDYGLKNEEIYGSREPPTYPLGSIKVPMLLVYGDQDLFAVEEDILKLWNSLSDDVKRYGKLKVEGYNHMDFLYGRDMKDRVYYRIVQFLDSLSK